MGADKHSLRHILAYILPSNKVGYTK